MPNSQKQRRTPAAGPTARMLRSGLGFWIALAFLPMPGAAVAQTPEHPDLRQAVAAYEAGQLDRARALLEAAPALLTARDAAIRGLYLGLVHFAEGEAGLAQDAFMRAVILDPSLRIDPVVHSPTRVQAFDAARAVVVEGWRTEAGAAEGRGDVVLAEQRWRSVLAAEPADSTAAARLAALEAARRPAPPITLPPTDTAAVEEVPPPDTTVQGLTARRSPGQALALGLLLPGLGEIYAGRPVLGVFALGAAAGALAAAFMVEKVDVRCATIPVNNFCPPEDIVSETMERPYLGAGVAAAAGITLLGALDAFLATRRTNIGPLDSMGSARLQVGPAGLERGPDGAVRLGWIRVAF